MTVRRGEVWYALLNPVRGSEQAGSRPVLIFGNNKVNRVSATTLAIPFTSNLRRSESPACLLVRAGEGGLSSDSVLLCDQLRVLDESRLERKIRQVSEETMAAAEKCVLFALGMD